MTVLGWLVIILTPQRSGFDLKQFCYRLWWTHSTGKLFFSEYFDFPLSVSFCTHSFIYQNHIICTVDTIIIQHT